jgi:hypothetical protein
VDEIEALMREAKMARMKAWRACAATVIGEAIRIPPDLSLPLLESAANLSHRATTIREWLKARFELLVAERNSRANAMR